MNLLAYLVMVMAASAEPAAPPTTRTVCIDSLMVIGIEDLTAPQICTRLAQALAKYDLHIDCSSALPAVSGCNTNTDKPTTSPLSGSDLGKISLRVMRVGASVRVVATVTAFTDGRQLLNRFWDIGVAALVGDAIFTDVAAAIKGSVAATDAINVVKAPETKASTSPRWNWPVVTLASTAVIAGGVGGYFGIKSFVDKQSFDKRGMGSQVDGRHALDEARVANILFAVAGLAAATGGGIWWWKASDPVPQLALVPGVTADRVINALWSY